MEIWLRSRRLISTLATRVVVQDLVRFATRSQTRAANLLHDSLPVT